MSPQAIVCMSLNRWQRKYRGQHITRAAAIRLKCLDCCANQPSEVLACPSVDCPLWGYRMGRSFESEPGKLD